MDFNLPAVLIWSPLVTYCDYFVHNSIVCETCCTKVHHSYWNDGSCSYKQPRLIHDVDNVVFLVSAVYTCENGHKLLATDSRLLNKLPSKTQIPFVLLHKTGFTRTFVNMVDSFCQTGMNFYSLEAAISHARWQRFEQNKEISLEMHKEESHVIASFQDSAAKYLPSDDLLRECFVANFLTNEHCYKTYIQSLNTGTALSFDHTYKVAANIGFLRSDNKWVTQYDSVFLGMNEIGQIVSWKFTKGNSFSEVKPMLTGLCMRAHMQGSQIQTVYIDNCCQWRRKLQEVFGQDCAIKLDLFHAVQRIVRKIPKRHPFHGTFCSELTLAFRQSGDYGTSRTKTTPQPSIVLSNLDQIKQKWKQIVYQGVPLLSDEAIEEIEKLGRHIMKGCLSDIPVGGGTNKNEAFHRYINQFFHKSRMGILLAYALMMAIICQFNSQEKSDKPIHKKILPPISALVSNVQSSSNTEELGLSASGIEDDHTWEHNDTDEELFDVEEFAQIIATSISQFSILKSLKHHSKTGASIWKYIPYMQMLPTAIFYRLQGTSGGLSEQQMREKSEHKQRLKATLLGWRFHLTPVVEDGNCFFTSVAFGLLQNATSIVLDLGIALESPISVLVSKLREVIVQEWLGPNRCEYEEFLTMDTCYESEANKFLTDGYYDSELGNSMPLAMSNALKVFIVVFSSQQGSPVYFVSSKYTSHHGLYLAYTAYGGGHYDHCVPMSDIDPPQPISKCRCGVNSRESNKENYVACKHGGRLSSCKCLAAGKPCTDGCRCKGCCNPFRVRPPKLGKRKRSTHPLQNVATTSNSFLLERDIATAHGSWSDFETIVFIHCVKRLETNMIECTDSAITYLYTVEPLLAATPEEQPTSL